MAGLKTFWIILCTLFLLAACVPQTKQTACGSNEAFNSSLRTCVPVVGGPTSFITISDFTPQFTQTRYKSDATTLSFTISVSNPYNQSYSIAWERVFNAGPVSMCSNSLTCSFSANLLGTTYGQIGTHILTAKVLDANGTVVDSHSFELKINDLPRPTINSAYVVPDSYAFEKYPTDDEVEFSLVIKNNGADFDATNNYRTEWTVMKNGSTLYTETDNFSNFVSSSTNSAYLGTSPTPYFDPGSLPVGSYIVRAVVKNDDPGEVVDEQQWNIIIREPDLANVTSVSLPAPGVTTTAHHSTDYDDYPTLSWVYGASNTQPKYCITVDDRDGTYAGDGKSIQVRWYLDSVGGEICRKTTLDTPGTQELCLVDVDNCDDTGAPFDVSLLKFTNSSSSVQQNHKVTARLFDEATTYEFERSDVIASSGSYPIEWTVLVKPVNAAPVLGFGTTQPTGCVSDGAYARKTCAVNQGQDFTVSFTVSDDFYTGADDEDEFEWDVTLKYDGADIVNDIETESCTKALGAAVPAYNTQWTCTIAVPDYTATGPVDPSSGSFTVLATLADSGSLVGGSALSAQSLTWKLVVTEKNNDGINLSAQQAVSTNDSSVAVSTTPTTALPFAANTARAAELESVIFYLNVSDLERDNLKYKISRCANAACATYTTLTSPAYIDFLRSIQADPDLNPVQITALSYQLPEDLLLTVGSDVGTTTGDAALVYFRVDVTDVPSVVVTPSITDTDFEIFSFYVQNVNPAPVIDDSVAVPAVGASYDVFIGFPFTIDPGTVTDPSGVASESTILYQWYSSDDAGLSWTAISSATSRKLTWTPGDAASIQLKLCVGDRPAANPIDPFSLNCSGVWTVTPKNYLHSPTTTILSNTEILSNEMAIWHDTTSVNNEDIIYTAYFGDDGLGEYSIYVNKIIKNADGDFDSTSFETVNFTALDQNEDSVSNLSITGTEDSLYIAYLTRVSGSDEHKPQVKRIDKSFAAAGTPGKKTNMAHLGKFGFMYNQYDIDGTSVIALDTSVTYSNGIGGTSQISIDSPLADGDTIVINGSTFTANIDASIATELCADTSLGCTFTTTAVAAELAQKINESTDTLLQGITAFAVASDVFLFGTFPSDHLEINYVVSNQSMGQIFIAGNYWYVPVVEDASVGTGQVVVISGLIDTHLADSVTLDLSAEILTEMGKTSLFSAKLDQDGDLLIARISTEVADAGSLKLFRFDPNGRLWDYNDDRAIFVGKVFQNVQLALAPQAGAINTRSYVLAKEQTVQGGEWNIGRYTADFATALEYEVEDRRATATDISLISDTLLVNPELVVMPNVYQAMLVFNSSGSLTPLPYMAIVDSNLSITCNECIPLTTETDPAVKMGVSIVSEDITFGDAGNVAAENTKNVIFTSFSLLSGVDYIPQIGVINVEAESIPSTTKDADGTWRPPFVK